MPSNERAQLKAKSCATPSRQQKILWGSLARPPSMQTVMHANRRSSLLLRTVNSNLSKRLLLKWLGFKEESMKLRTPGWLWLFALVLTSGALVRAADPFSENVRTTDPLTPEQQQKTFHPPPGF